ncbi:hypothetical protein [Agromyces sp. LHK192]|uniref:hypothetical protein n=1 Tax=Agromyces sp. LHK192 TaxID=2498704 RepID=UPI000FD8B86F|nr:hypothetical protein [Agromyces sp. LHK192]
MPGVIGLALLAGAVTAVATTLAQLLVDSYNPVLSLAWLPSVLAVAVPTCLLVSMASVAAGLGVRAAVVRLTRAPALAAMLAGSMAAATAAVAAVVLSESLSVAVRGVGLGAAVLGGIALGLWSLKCAAPSGFTRRVP